MELSQCETVGDVIAQLNLYDPDLPCVIEKSTHIGDSHGIAYITSEDMPSGQEDLGAEYVIIRVGELVEGL